MRIQTLLICTILAAGSTAVCAQERTPAPAGAAVYFIALKNGAKVSSPFTVRFGLRGMGIAPAGIKFENSGHHHLLIDTDPPPPEAPLPASDKILHFGKGQTETTLSLAPGRHRLQLVLGDALHVPHNPPVMSKPITITVLK